MYSLSLEFEDKNYLHIYDNAVQQFMTHTVDYGEVQYTPIILQYSEILKYHFFKT